MTQGVHESGSMFVFVQSVMLATYYEHQRATGHDAFAMRHRLSIAGINCNVCLHLGAAKRDMDNIEAESYEAGKAEDANGQ